MKHIYPGQMTDSPNQSKAFRTEITGEFLDHETGQSHSYVARFRKVANDVLWSANVKLGGRWVTLRDQRVPGAAKNSDFAVSELVRDSVIDSMYGEEMDGRMAAAHREHRRLQIWRRVMILAAFCVVVGSLGLWLS